MEKLFCPRCGSKLETRRLENRDRGFCPACRVVHYENPVPATAVVAFNERNELLLVRRAVEPGKGKWCLPGGFQEMGETPAQCARRELMEETGLAGEVQELIALEMGRNPQAGDVLVAGYRALVCGGELRAGDDATAAAYFPLDRLPELAFQSHARIIERVGRPVLARLRFRSLPGGAHSESAGS
jgi:8-oxo-dGTP diphosphatase